MKKLRFYFSTMPGAKLTFVFVRSFSALDSY